MSRARPSSTDGEACHRVFARVKARNPTDAAGFGRSHRGARTVDHVSAELGGIAHAARAHAADSTANPNLPSPGRSKVSPITGVSATIAAAGQMFIAPMAAPGACG